MRVLVACEFSGVVRQAFRKRGHDAWSCDLLPAEDSSLFHLQMDAIECTRMCSWDLMIAHPPCTYLGVSGFHWCYHYPKNPKPGVLYGEERRAASEDAVNFVRKLVNAAIPHIVIENPNSILSSRIRKADQTIQPWQFGHPEFKATCLWLHDVPLLKPTHVLTPPLKGTAEYLAWSGIHRMSPGPDRWRERSRTYQGIAEAMAEQWGNL